MADILKKVVFDKNKRVVDYAVIESKDMSVVEKAEIFGDKLSIRGNGKFINNGLIMTDSDIKTKPYAGDEKWLSQI